jgi:hypothetical protein
MVTKEKTTRRHKDISRLVREKKRLERERIRRGGKRRK